MKKNRRDFMKNGLVTAAAILSGAGIYEMTGETEETECDYREPTYSVSVSPDDQYMANCGEGYSLGPVEDEKRPAGIPEELYDNSSPINGSE